MKSETTPTRERILRSGLDLMSQTGISGVTLSLLAEEASMSKSGLFAHFRSKEALQIALLGRMAEVAVAHVVLPAMDMPEGLPRLEAVVGRWLGWTQQVGLRGGCPVAAATFELDDVEGAVREHVLTMDSDWRSFLAELVRAAVSQEHLRSDLDVDQFVWELYGIYLSHHISYRFVRDLAADVRADTALKALIRRALPG